MSDVLMSVEELRSRLGEPRLRIADVRFDLADTAKGEAAYRAAHVPGAIYAHLDRDLSDHALKGVGRHPLPAAAAFARWLSQVGYAPDQSWVMYDEANGGFAARLWWMLRAVGHRDVRVLDGGHAAWIAAGAPVTDLIPDFAPTLVDVRYAASATADFGEVDALRTDRSRRLVDARAAPRFRGEVEPLDPVAGHVPGAVNRPFADNLDPSGRFKSPEQLGAEWRSVLGDVAADRVVHMCGSGVTACHNLLAMELAGLTGSKLFAPSWSGWIADRRRAVATGDA
ncbi:MAG TPA: sulfurtransferase [Patescibacteria group bacterium]|nr:sulfurtransferase [Patescibacteria group bacterium]